MCSDIGEQPRPLGPGPWRPGSQSAWATALPQWRGRRTPERERPAASGVGAAKSCSSGQMHERFTWHRLFWITAGDPTRGLLVSLE